MTTIQHLPEIHRSHLRAGMKIFTCFWMTVAIMGCTHLGPGTVAVDRFDYSSAIADSWKQQTLLNIVKLRYMDLPVFVDVASIVAGYSLQTGVTVTGVSSSAKAVQGDYGSIGGQAVYTDRPTITYVPMTGEKFLRGLITPIDPKNIFFMLQSGYAADFILGLTVESINGVRNRSTSGGVAREADPDFVKALGLLREVQAAGGVGMRVEEDKVKGATGIVIFRPDDLPPDIVEKAAAYAASHGKDQLIAEVNKKDGPFVSGDLYVFVFNEKGITIAHPVNPALIGKDNVNEPDADGKLFRKEIVQVAETKGSGWVNYKFKNPANGNIEPKISYVKKQGDVIIIAGVYLK